ncbi:DUF305 domain-containing protein, partial [bacterium]|nr:DUF305 domain-containing protein [bacterium]
MDHKEAKGNYKRLIAMTVLSFISMYVLMYAMVNSYDNVFSNLNQLYMAGLMIAAMVIIEFALMRDMYHKKNWNFLILALSGAALILCWVFIRQQTGISDKQFFKSMIPHHAGAILMCDEAQIKDPEIKELCKNIISSQQSEINQM